MAELLNAGRRTGRTVVSGLVMPAGQTQIELSMPFEASGLGVDPVGVVLTLEQSADGVLFWPIARAITLDLRAISEQTDKAGNLHTAIALRATEQIYRHDVYREFSNWREAYELKRDEDGAHYHMLALAPEWRVTVDCFLSDPAGWDQGGTLQDRLSRVRVGDTALRFSLDGVHRLTARPETPIGRRSASLLGTFAEAEASASSTVTSGSRTTVSGSLIAGQGGSWHNATPPTNAITDDKSNGYTEHFEISQSAASSFGSGVLSTNIGGTRGASHEVIETTTASSCSVGGLEFDGLDATPSIDVGTNATGTSSGPSCSVTPTTTALVVGLMIYLTGALTFAPNVGTTGIEVDEGNDRQATGSLYRVAQASGAGSTTSWTLSSSSEWACRSIAVEEGAGDSVALTGTVTDSITEADIVAGGKTIILTLTGDTWITN